MTAELTIYRCYWPKAYEYLKTFNITNFKTEAFGLLMTIDIDSKQAQRIVDLLPVGAALDLVHQEDLDLFSGIEVEGLDFDFGNSLPTKPLKN